MKINNEYRTLHGDITPSEVQDFHLWQNNAPGLSKNVSGVIYRKVTSWRAGARNYGTGASETECS